MRNNAIIILFVMLTIIPFTLAKTEYNFTGSSDTDYKLGTGIFNSQITTDSIEIKVLSDIIEHPLVSDLDGDGVNEIVVIDDDEVKLFVGSDLTLVDTFDYGTADRLSNVLLFDIENDGKIEIIFIEETDELLHILEYNGSLFTNQSTKSLSGLTHTDGGFMIRCGEVEQCLMVYAERDDAVSSTSLSVAGFNSTSIGSELVIDTEGTTSFNYCMPKIRHIAYDTFNTGDSIKDYVFAVMEFKSGVDETLHIFRINLANGLIPSEEDQASHTSIGLFRDINPLISTLPDCVSSNSQRFYSSAIVDDFDGSSSNGLEAVIGVNINSNEFVIGMFDSDLDLEDDFPEVFDADGVLVSNPMIATVFGDSPISFCVLGFDAPESELDLLCATDDSLTGALFGSLEFRYDFGGQFNVTQDYGVTNVLTHSAQHSSGLINIGETNIIDTSEFLTTYGVFQLSDDTFNGSIFSKSLNRLFENPAGDSSCIQVDVNKEGSEDIICGSDTALYYIDDGLENQPAIITDVTINPCLDSVIKINSTMQVLVTVTDQNSEVLGQDLVSSNVTIYDGGSNEQKSSVLNTASGTVMAHSFDINETGAGITMTIEGFDNQLPTQVDTITQTFTVATNGVEFGDCTTEISITPTVPTAPTEITEATLTQDADQNAIVTGLNTLSNTTNLGGTTIFLLILLIVSIAIWFEMAKRDMSGSSALGMIAIVNVLGIILGTRIGVFSTSLVVILVILAVVIIGVFLGRFLLGSSNAQ